MGGNGDGIMWNDGGEPVVDGDMVPRSAMAMPRERSPDGAALSASGCLCRRLACAWGRWRRAGVPSGDGPRCVIV